MVSSLDSVSTLSRLCTGATARKSRRKTQEPRVLEGSSYPAKWRESLYAVTLDTRMRCESENAQN